MGRGVGRGVERGMGGCRRGWGEGQGNNQTAHLLLINSANSCVSMTVRSASYFPKHEKKTIYGIQWQCIYVSA